MMLDDPLDRAKIEGFRSSLEYANLEDNQLFQGVISMAVNEGILNSSLLSSHFPCTFEDVNHWTYGENLPDTKIRSIVYNLFKSGVDRILEENPRQPL